MTEKHRIPLLCTGLVLFLLYIPILILIFTSFNESRFGISSTEFSFKWYIKLFQDPQIWQSLSNSLLIAITATIASTLLGITAAFSLYRYKSNLQKLHYGLVYTPLVIPDILMGISLLLFFVALRFQLGLFTIFTAHTTFCISYVTMVLLARLQQFERSIIEAAQDLGANSWQVICRVVIPLLLPGIAAGALLAFTLSIDDFVITFFVAGPGSTTLPIHVYSMIKFGSTPVINALSTCLFLLTFCLVFITQRLLEKK